jgi:hypothetical protein
MGVVSTRAFSFMSKYLHQYCSPKPMARVDINDNNQSSNTTKELDQYVSLFKEYIYVFDWTYDDLKDYDKTVFQHIIPLREEANPVKQKVSMMNPKLKLMIKFELEKLKKVGIIYPIRHSD